MTRGALAVPKLIVETVGFTLNTCFLSGSLEFCLVHVKQKLSTQSVPKETLGAESLLSFPSRRHFTSVVTARC